MAIHATNTLGELSKNDEFFESGKLTTQGEYIWKIEHGELLEIGESSKIGKLQ